MEFCIISPTAGLERYARLTRTHLVLAHVEDSSYVKFYRERALAGDFIILDNGAYETGEPKYDHFEVALNMYEPSVIVLPDYPLQPWQKTWHAAIAWLDRYAGSGDFYNREYCYIPQSTKGDLHGFLESYQEAASDSRITWIGIPRSLAYAITDNPLARVEFARMVRKDHPGIKLHAFGMVNGDVHELPYLAAAGVNSIDSSAPVWRGWNFYDINDPNWDGKPVDFSASEVKNAHGGILDNLKKCGVPPDSFVRAK